MARAKWAAVKPACTHKALACPTTTRRAATVSTHIPKKARLFASTQALQRDEATRPASFGFGCTHCPAAAACAAPTRPLSFPLQEISGLAFLATMPFWFQDVILPCQGFPCMCNTY